MSYSSRSPFCASAAARAHVSSLNYTQHAWSAHDAATPDREANVLAINEASARQVGAIALGVPGWRVRVRPALRSSGLA